MSLTHPLFNRYFKTITVACWFVKSTQERISVQCFVTQPSYGAARRHLYLHGLCKETANAKDLTIDVAIKYLQP